MLTHSQPVVAGKHDPCVLTQPGFINRTQHTTDLVIQVRDHRIVGRQMLPGLVFASRMPGQHLVSDHQFTIVEGMLRQKVVRQFHLGARIQP